MIHEHTAAEVDMRELSIEDDEKLIYVSTVEEYAFRHGLKVSDVLRIFKKYGIEKLLKSQYEVLHMLDISDSVSMVEGILGRASCSVTHG